MPKLLYKKIKYLVIVMAAKKRKMLNKGKTKIRERKEIFSKKTKLITKKKVEIVKGKSNINLKLKSIKTVDWIQIAIIIILLAYLSFIILKFHEII